MAVGFVLVVAALTDTVARSRQTPVFAIPPQIDIGELAEASDREIVYPFLNSGRAVLRVSAGDANCACRKIRIDPPECPPGQWGQVRFTVTPSGSPGSEQPTSIRLNSNDPSRREIVVTAIGRMLHRVLPEPASISVSQVLSGATWTEKLTIRATDDSAIRVNRVAVLGDEAGRVETRVDGQQIVLSGVAAETEWSGRLAVEIDSKRFPVLLVPIQIRSSSRVVAQPSSLVFDVRDARQGVSLPLSLRLPPAGSIQSVVLESEQECIEVTAAAPVDEGPTADGEVRYSVQLAKMPQSSGRVIRGEIVFELQGVPHETRRRVPFVVLSGPPTTSAASAFPGRSDAD